MNDKSDISKQSCNPLQNFFRKAFVQYVTVRSMRKWTYKNADEKAHTFSWRSKNVKKLTKTDEKRILWKSALKQTKDTLVRSRFTHIVNQPLSLVIANTTTNFVEMRNSKYSYADKLT